MRGFVLVAILLVVLAAQASCKRNEAHRVVRRSGKSTTARTTVAISSTSTSTSTRATTKSTTKSTTKHKNTTTRKISTTSGGGVTTTTADTKDDDTDNDDNDNDNDNDNDTENETSDRGIGESDNNDFLILTAILLPLFFLACCALCGSAFYWWCLGAGARSTSETATAVEERSATPVNYIETATVNQIPLVPLAVEPVEEPQPMGHIIRNPNYGGSRRYYSQPVEEPELLYSAPGEGVFHIDPDQVFGPNGRNYSRSVGRGPRPLPNNLPEPEQVPWEELYRDR